MLQVCTCRYLYRYTVILALATTQSSCSACSQSKRSLHRSERPTITHTYSHGHLHGHVMPSFSKLALTAMSAMALLAGSLPAAEACQSQATSATQHNVKALLDAHCSCCVVGGCRQPAQVSAVQHRLLVRPEPFAVRQHLRLHVELLQLRRLQAHQS